MYIACLIVSLLLHCPDALSSALNSTYLCTVYTPNSILEQKENFRPHILDGRTRYSTCTGAAWFHKTYLAVLNLYGRNITSYKFSAEEKTFELFQTLGNQDGAALYNPENLTASPDGTVLAVCSDAPDPGVQLYAIDPETHCINPRPLFSLQAKGLVHNVRFTSDNTFLALTGWDPEKSVCIYKIIRNGNSITLNLVHSLGNDRPIKPKGINFTKNDAFAVVCYAPRVTKEAQQQTGKRESLVVSYPFDTNTGKIGDAVSYKKITSTAEDLAFLHNDTEIMMTDQANDQLIICPFNPHTGQIGDTYTSLHNPEAHVSFPHGLGVSDNGKFFVVTNYGDDTFNLYEAK